MSDGATIAPAILLAGGGFLGGGKVLEVLSRHDLVRQALVAAVARGEIEKRDALFLNLRIRGYSTRAAARHWQLLRTDGGLARAERRFLQLDLLFPLVYGAAFAGGLWLLRGALERRADTGWLIAPVVIGVLADWVENFIQLRELDRFLRGERLQTGWIRIASVATIVKLISLSGAVLLIVLGVIWGVAKALSTT
jgi:hypothetical protein